jgi:hypothetical protein
MTKLNLALATSVCAIASFLAGYASAETDAPTRYELHALSTYTAPSCEGTHSFRQELTLCNAGNCTTLDVTDAPTVEFALSRDGRATLTAAARDHYGQIVGSATNLKIQPAHSARFQQSVQGSADCHQTVIYRLEAER